jgi:hypothetical protein
MADDPIAQHFFTCFIRLHILHHAAEEPIYGAEIGGVGPARLPGRYLFSGSIHWFFMERRA